MGTLQSWDIPSSSGHGWYTVEERTDTVYGGKYLYCPCAGWAFQKGKGTDCRHVKDVKAQMGMAPELPRGGARAKALLRPEMYAPKAISQPVLDQYGLPVDSDASKARILADQLATHQLGTCGGPRGAHSLADHEAWALVFGRK